MEVCVDGMVSSALMDIHANCDRRCVKEDACSKQVSCHDDSTTRSMSGLRRQNSEMYVMKRQSGWCYNGCPLHKPIYVSTPMWH